MSISLKNDAGTFSTHLNQSNPTANVNIALPTTSGTIAVFASGTKLVFAQSTAPAGWVQVVDDTADNRMLRIVNGNGGATGGSHSPILNNVVPSHTHGFTTGGHSSDHSHSGSTGTISSDHQHLGGFPRPSGFPQTNSLFGTSSQGSNYSSTAQAGGTYTGVFAYTGGVTSNHVHGFSTGGVNADHTHSGSTDNGSSQTNWTPRYIDLILCEKA
jgi:hypothetical protein